MVIPGVVQMWMNNKIIRFVGGTILYILYSYGISCWNPHLSDT